MLSGIRQTLARDPLWDECPVALRPSEILLDPESRIRVGNAAGLLPSATRWGYILNSQIYDRDTSFQGAHYGPP